MRSLLSLLHLLILSLLALHGLHILWLYIQRWLNPKEKREPTLEDVREDDLPTVLVQIPVYNEKSVIERILFAASEMDYPAEKLSVQILDDSTDETTEIIRTCLAEKQERFACFELIHREQREGYKAGALQVGLERSTSELVAIFDADFVPPRDFLLRIVPCFKDPKVGMVQTRWGHLNEHENTLTKLQAIYLDAHFLLESGTRDQAGMFVTFNGSGGVWRRDCINQSGGWQADTLTEDLDLSYRAQLKGWKFRFLEKVVVPAELPEDAIAFRNQQARWAQGGAETFRKLMGQILRSSAPLKCKIEAVFHLTSSLVFPLLLGLTVVSYPAVLVRLEESTFKVLLVDLPLFLLGVVAINGFYAHAQWMLHPFSWMRMVKIPFLLCLSNGLVVPNTIAVLKALTGRKGIFVRTPKKGTRGEITYRASGSLNIVLDGVLAGYLLVCMIHAIHTERWGMLPFLLAFCGGYAGMIGMVVSRRWIHRVRNVLWRETGECVYQSSYRH